MMSSNKAYVLMSMPDEESWGPVAVFPNEEDADLACSTLNIRMFGGVKGRDERGAYQRFSVHPVDFDPDIKHTGKQRYWRKYPDDDMEGIEGYPVELDVDADPDEMYSIATKLERGDIDDWFLRDDTMTEKDK